MEIIQERRKKKMKRKYMIGIILLLALLVLSSFPSLALIPGDFNGDGQVQFEDLMIFALAYGSTPEDPNWNPVCDIATTGGVLEPDGFINFEDLMIFALHYGECDVVQNVHAIALTTPYSLTGTVPSPESMNIVVSGLSKGNIIEGRELKIENAQFIVKNLPLEQLRGEKGDTGENYYSYSTLIYWDPYFENDGDEEFNYRVYRSIDGVNYSDITSETLFLRMYGSSDTYKDACIDINMDPNTGNTYSYYITAYGNDWETVPGSEVSIDTWIPTYCTLNTPLDGALINEMTPNFTWSPVGLESFPYGSIVSGESDLWVVDTTATEESWWITFPDLMTSTATYNQDGQADALVPGHSYGWDSYSYGYNQEGELIALSICDLWSINYNIAEGSVSNIYAVAVTSQSGGPEHSVEIYWDAYPEALSYDVYRSVNGEDYTLLPEASVLSKEFPPDNNCIFWVGGGGITPICPGYIDDNVSPENTYSYYVIAQGDGWETAQSETATVDTWLPACSLLSPPDNSSIDEANPTFCWDSGVSSLPYDSISSGNVYLGVWNEMDPILGWSRYFDDITLSSAIYNQDGQGDPLFSGNSYQWGVQIDAYDSEGNYIARSSSENWNFSYLNENSDIVLDISDSVIFENKTYVSAGEHNVTVSFPETISGEVLGIITGCQGDYSRTGEYDEEIVFFPDSERKIWTGSFSFGSNKLSEDLECCASVVEITTTSGECGDTSCITLPVIVDDNDPYIMLELSTNYCELEGCSVTFSLDDSMPCCGDDCTEFSDCSVAIFGEQPFDSSCQIPLVEPIYCCGFSDPGVGHSSIFTTDCLIPNWISDDGNTYYENVNAPICYYVLVDLIDLVGNKEEYYAQFVLSRDNYNQECSIEVQEFYPDTLGSPGNDCNCTDWVYGPAWDVNDNSIGSCWDMDICCSGEDSVCIPFSIWY